MRWERSTAAVLAWAAAWAAGLGVRSTAAVLDQGACTLLEVRSPAVAARSPAVAGRTFVVPAAHSLAAEVERKLAVVEGSLAGAGRTFVFGDIPASPLPVRQRTAVGEHIALVGHSLGE